MRKGEKARCMSRFELPEATGSDGRPAEPLRVHCFKDAHPGDPWHAGELVNGERYAVVTWRDEPARSEAAA